MLEQVKIKYNDKIDLQGYFWHGTEKGKAFILIAHGMAEHLMRYDSFAEFFVGKGYSVIGSDHFAHGYSVADVKDIGVIRDEDFITAIIKSIKMTLEYFKDEIGDKPVYLFSHSMGSMTAQRYVELYPDDFSKVVLSGTDYAPCKYSLAKTVASSVIKKHGEISYVPFLENMGCGAFNKKFKKEGDFAWLSRNREYVDKYIADERCGVQFPSNYYKSLAISLVTASKKENLALINKNCDFLLVAGQNDPVGSFSKGPKKLYKRYKKLGLSVNLIVYAGARHEVHNEIDDTKNALLNDLNEFFG